MRPRRCCLRVEIRGSGVPLTTQRIGGIGPLTQAHRASANGRKWPPGVDPGGHKFSDRRAAWRCQPPTHPAGVLADSSLLWQVVLSYRRENLHSHRILENFRTMLDIAWNAPAVARHHILFLRANREPDVPFYKVSGLLVRVTMFWQQSAFLQPKFVHQCFFPMHKSFQLNTRAR